MTPEQHDRIEAMAADRGETWDLSPNDQDALRAILAEIARLRSEVETLKGAIRQHRDERGDDRCWLDDTRLYAVLGEGDVDGYEATLPPREDFLASCKRYWEQRQTPLRHGEDWLPGCMTIAQLTAQVETLGRERDAVVGALIVENDVLDLDTLKRVKQYRALLPVKRDGGVLASWTETTSKAEAVAAVRKAAGLEG